MQASAESRKVLRNTYMLLAMTLAFSGVVAGVSAALGLPHPGLILTLVGYFGLLFAVTKFRDSALGVGLVFALTGFMGYTLGPIIGRYLALPNGGDIVTMAMAGTAVIFFSMSAIALTSKRDFSFLGNFLMVGIIVAFLAGLAAVFFQMPVLSLVVSAAFVLLMSGLILYETNAILQGGETNYVMATVSLYVSIYNLFTSLLHLLGAFGGDD
ncbi:Bax inhibitor-1/YccA family protein [Azovibrio restrictus]|uniref:Bax inhibitor-1/YccA family protein n=1 Tax=Azovibrio restrictus TaxID=146938 RepID=UPI0026EA90C2|nr:Bax inhibitor-1/YccA family protein [Azovibrio restrictus]MDD3483964.1 Bax inhibitor-1/YccA family protein [Azovibrio restrictus]